MDPQIFDRWLGATELGEGRSPAAHDWLAQRLAPTIQRTTWLVAGYEVCTEFVVGADSRAGLGISDGPPVLLETPQGSPRTAGKGARRSPKRRLRTGGEQVEMIVPPESGRHSSKLPTRPDPGPPRRPFKQSWCAVWTVLPQVPLASSRVRHLLNRPAGRRSDRSWAGARSPHRTAGAAAPAAQESDPRKGSGSADG